MISNVTTNRAQSTNFGAIAVNKKYADAFTKAGKYAYDSNDIRSLEIGLLVHDTGRGASSYSREAAQSLDELHSLVTRDTAYILNDAEKAEFDQKSGKLYQHWDRMKPEDVPVIVTCRKLPQYLLEKVKTATTIPDEVAQKAVAEIELAETAARNIRRNVVGSILNTKV